MCNEIMLFLRLLSFYVGFTLIMALPAYGYQLIIFSGNNSIIINIYAHIIYHSALALIIWFLAPPISRKISNKYLINFNINGMLRVGLILIGVKGLFDNFMLLSSSFLKGTLKSWVLVHKGSSLTSVSFNQDAVFAAISIMIVVIFLVNYKKVESFLK